MTNFRLTFVLLLFVQAVTVVAAERGFALQRNQFVSISYKDDGSVLNSAVCMLNSDLGATLNSGLIKVEHDAQIVVDVDSLMSGEESFELSVTQNNRLLVHASDTHGAAYGLLEISRLLGVSPWEWWADATPRPQKRFFLPSSFRIKRSPSVRYRGIFINDEDWGLMPWSSQTMEPENERGVIGPRTTERIFQLLLRLRANTYWPPMHPTSRAFFLTEGCREMARKYGVYIGTSHCEPMACNAASEWEMRGNGDYNFVTNSEAVKSFWQQRVDEVRDQEIIYTVGMRGVHDGAMQGVKGLRQHHEVLQRVIDEQIDMLPSDAPKVFIPYKEVLDVYNDGLRLPEDVTLMWTDDNYGYIRRFPTPAENARRGGNGVYYHVSYWGRPHDYLWLGTFSPYLLQQQMSTAYQRGIRQMWILNVGDIKPAEYQIELFMDMAWDITRLQSSASVKHHLSDWLKREFRDELSSCDLKTLTSSLLEYYRLCFIHRPEFMAGTRTEESDRVYWGTPRHISWPHDVETPAQRLQLFDNLADKISSISKRVGMNRRDTFYQLVEYPILATAQMNHKYLAFDTTTDVVKALKISSQAYDSITAMTDRYNRGFYNGGKWNGIMDASPRRLPVFSRLSSGLAPAENKRNEGVLLNYPKRHNSACEIMGLGYHGKALGLPKGASVDCSLALSSRAKSIFVQDSVDIELHFLPTHPFSSEGLRIEVSLDGSGPVEVNYTTYDRSEEWKQNVLWNRSVRVVRLPLSGRRPSVVTLKALTEGVVLDF